MYDDILDEIPESLVRYLRILEKSSIEFQERLKDFNAKYNNSDRSLNQKLSPKVISNFMEYFFIPDTKQNHAVVNAYLMANYLAPKYGFRYAGENIVGLKGESIVHRPTLFIEIYAKLSEAEWEKMRKQVGDFENQARTKMRNLGYQKYDKPFFRKMNTNSWPNMDEKLTLYRMYKTFGSYTKVSDEIKRQIDELEAPIFKRGKTPKEIDKKIENLKKLIQKL